MEWRGRKPAQKRQERIRVCFAQGLPCHLTVCISSDLRPLEPSARPQFVAATNEPAYWPSGGCHSSTLFPSGSMTQANLPYSDSSIFSSTLQPSSFKTLT